MMETALLLFAAGAVQAPSPPVALRPIAEEHDEQEPPSRWFLRTGLGHAHYNTKARIATRGNTIPGATVDVADSTTLVVDIGYDLTDDVSVMFTAGIPPSADVSGEGSVASFGKLGRVRFGPVVLTAIYRLPPWKGFRPYVGAGAAHLFILRTDDGSVKDLKVHDHNGLVAQAGVEYRLNRKWELFADYKRIWLNVHATGFLANEPVRARVTLNPDLVSAGVKFHFD